MTKEELIDRIKKEGTLILSEEFDNSAIENIKNNPEIPKYSSMIEFIQKYGAITFSRIENESKDELIVHINVIALTYSKILLELHSEWHSDKKSVIDVASISNASGKIESFFMNEDGKFFNSETKLIADNADEFFEYLLTVEYDYHAPILPQTLDILRKAGWYENRKTDISDLINKYKNEGIEISESQISFMQEFGGIKGEDAEGSKFEICIEPKYSKFRKSKPLDPKDFESYGPLNVVGNKENVDFLLAGSLSNYMVYFWISTDGRLYADQGFQSGRTIMEGLQRFLVK